MLQPFSLQCLHLSIVDVEKTFILAFSLYDLYMPSICSWPGQLSSLTLCCAQTAPRECFICGHLAQYECLQCLSDRKLQPGRIKQYCSTCNTQVYLIVITHTVLPVTTLVVTVLSLCFFCFFLNQVHSHHTRQSHSPKALEVSLNAASVAPVPRHTMQLFAVLCIHTSHYVSFVKYGSDPHAWLFFDSMADRCGEWDSWFVSSSLTFLKIQWNIVDNKVKHKAVQLKYWNAQYTDVQIRM